MTGTSSDSDAPTEHPPRRSFLTAATAAVVGGLAAAGPLLAAAFSALDPLRRGQSDQELVRVTRLAAIPDSGAPKKFTIATDRTDAWTTYRDAPVGAVYLRKSGDDVVAFNVVCPHAGCFVGVDPSGERFACPCHGSSFALDGSINDPASPSPRGLDSLDVEVRNGDEVWVRFQNFLPGRAEKTPV